MQRHSHFLLAWLRAHLHSDPSDLRPTALRVHVGGDNARRDLDDWPPAAATTSWYPVPGGHLTRQPPADSAPLTTFRYASRESSGRPPRDTGTGSIGATLARTFSAGGHEVEVANSRGPQTVDAAVLEFGARAATAQDAVRDKDVVILSVPFGRIPDLAPLFASVSTETVVIDTPNYSPQLGIRVDAVDQGQVESLWVTEQLGRPVVKTANAALAGTLQTRGVPSGTPGRIALPVAADSEEARRMGMRLVAESGFAPYDAGALADSWRQQPMTPAYCTELVLPDLKRALAAADRDEAPPATETAR
ncbi:NAD(P)-binding domain-containing protein [Streptomyces sp. NPDC056568]|uniref:NADPH-dependent F420 reductase n=1 Tax=Streptomyces sp. NPDC056568 TaxID=3345866 RepID=UPI0036BDEA3E